MNHSLKLSAFLTLLGGAHLSYGATLFVEEFDGNTNGYNSDSTTAAAGDNDWVDFSNRMTSDSYAVASGGTESVLASTSASNDPQVRSDFALGLNKASIESFELRLESIKTERMATMTPLRMVISTFSGAQLPTLTQAQEISQTLTSVWATQPHLWIRVMGGTSPLGQSLLAASPPEQTLILSHSELTQSTGQLAMVIHSRSTT